MIELPQLFRLSLLGAAFSAAITLAACSNGDGTNNGSGGGSSVGTGGTSGTGGGGAECIPKEGMYEFCSPADCTCPPDVTGVDLITPVSFREHIYPSMPASCGEGSLCHGSDQATGYSFGTAETPLTDAEISALIAQFKMPSPVANIPNVIDGNWQGSYLMIKLDGCQNHSNLNCDPEAPGLGASACVQECDALFCDPLPCGDAMPPSTAGDTLTATYPLSPELRNKVRAWIAQGALDN